MKNMDPKNKNIQNYFVDTNLFLRLIVDDKSNLNKKAKSIFLEASYGKYRLFTSAIVFFEIYWVLKSFYQKNKEEILIILKNILRMDFCRIENKKIISQAVLYFEKHNLELEDCYNIFFATKFRAKKIITFDKKLEKSFNKLA